MPSAKPGRKMHFPEKRIAPLRKGTLAAIDDLKGGDETRADFIRLAVDREIERRSSVGPSGERA